jgi:hypothetical protein
MSSRFDRESPPWFFALGCLLPGPPRDTINLVEHPDSLEGGLAMRLSVLALVLSCFTPGIAGLAWAGDVPPLFQPPRRPILPAVKNASWPNNPIDVFVLARLEAKGLAPNRPANRLSLLRRLTFTLTGLPPSEAEIQSWANDRSPQAYEKLVDRLLASPRFGERLAGPWLDLVRYAETDGFKEDALRPAAHKYRDYVIRAFNTNLPYDAFVRQQLAGDELEPTNPEALIATGFNRLWPDEYNAANLEQRRQEILDDTTDTAGLVFLGLTIGCARCHDHKYDPLSQKEYYRLQSFFAAMQPRQLCIANEPQRRDHQRRLAAWEATTAEVRKEMESILASKREHLRAVALTKFRTEIQEAYKTPPGKRTPYQWQIALMAEKQLDRAGKDAPAKLPAAQKKRYQELERKLAALGAPPHPLPEAMAITDIGPAAPPTHRLVGGDWRKPAAEVRPGFPEALGKVEIDARLPSGIASTGRRAALARWLTRPDHPLTARVMVNRLWQHHIGVGLVATASDFGAQGGAPSHPELLDWLAVELVESGWDLKHIHRLILTSAAYRQDSRIDPSNSLHARALSVDRDNRLLWRGNRRRLEGEALRDAMLFLSGELNLRMFGPSARPILPANLSRYAWKPDDSAEERNRRSVYVLAKRNLRYPMFDVFDLPDMHNSCSRRLQTTTAPQALLLLNDDETLSRAARWSSRLRSKCGEDQEKQLAAAYSSAWCRKPDAKELRLGAIFLERAARLYREKGQSAEEARALALADFCHALLNTNEFAYLD